MIVKSLICILIYLLVDNVTVLSQICSSRRIVTKRVMEAQLRWYKETYYGHCYRSCIKTKWTTRIEQVPVTKRDIQIFHVCCDGYININYETNSAENETMPITCKAICMPACKNGFCQSPGVCSCDPGYTVDPADKHNCLPVCLKDCRHGFCITPETCQCNFGYNIVNGTCEPVCTEPCDNGTCVAPETCECLPGYRKSDRNTCEPYCSSGCLHGSCASPETCICSPGFSMQVIDSENNTSCQPACSPPCDNGTCIAPNICQCNPGYQISGVKNCKPHCSSGCSNGRCVDPETCICNEGWRMNIDTACNPICDTECGNGTCVSPNTCDCHLGYKLNEVNSNNVIDTPMCVPNCNDCGGTCVDPNVCICDPPFESQNLTADGRTCDCHENCTDGMRKCERTACIAVIREKYFETDEATEVSNSSSTANTYNTIDIDNSYSSANISDSDSEASTMDSNHWILIYVASALSVIFIVIVSATIAINWKYIIIYFKGSSYIVEDDKEVAVFESPLRILQEKHGIKKTRDNKCIGSELP